MYKFSEEIENGIIYETIYIPIIKLIYPDGKFQYIYIDLDNLPKENELFNNKYKYAEISIKGVHIDGRIDGFIRLEDTIKLIE